MKKIAIIAPTGMLGSMIYNVLRDKYELLLVYRDEEKRKFLEQTYSDSSKNVWIKFDLSEIFTDYQKGFSQATISPSFKQLLSKIENADFVLNCAGVIKPHSLINPAQTMFLNSFLPHLFSFYFKEKLIHITTDCAFSGIEGAPYSENALKSPNDLYGLSKTLGEPYEKSLVLRTSIIGPELGVGFSLIAWFLKQNGQTIKGFTNHLWNGVTTREFGKICEKILSQPTKFPKTGLYHIFGSTVTKYEMLIRFKEKYGIDVNIEPVESNPIDRRLSTIYDFCENLQIPSFEKMLEQL